MENIEKLSEIVAKQESYITSLEQKLKEKEMLVKYYEEQILLAKHRRFGASSEKSQYDHSQLLIFDEAETTASPTLTEPKLVEIEKHYRKAKRAGSDRLPENIPVEYVEHELPAEIGRAHV